MGRILSGLALLSACGEPVYEHAGSPHSFLEDREACVKEIEQSPGAIAYRQNPAAHPDYVSQVFTDMNRCIERKGWKQVSAQREQGSQSGTPEFAQAGYPAPRLDPKATGVGMRGIEESPASVQSAMH
jgi:hypothetical protein